MTTPNDPNNLPPKLQEIYHKLSEPYIKITETIAKQPLSPLTSKYGGVPYIPEDEDCLRDEHGYPFLLFAQFNFAEIYEQVGQFDDLPTQGLLQLFMPMFCMSDILTEREYEEIARKCVRFYPTLPTKPINQKVCDEINALWQEIGTMYTPIKDSYERRKIYWDKSVALENKYNCGYIETPFFCEIALSFSKSISQSTDQVSLGEELYNLYESLSEEEKIMLEDTFDRELYSGLLGLGGYLQGDPRSNNERYRLFFQFHVPDAKEETLGAFIDDWVEYDLFIDKNDLKKHDFSDTWFDVASY